MVSSNKLEKPCSEAKPACLSAGTSSGHGTPQLPCHDLPKSSLVVTTMYRLWQLSTMLPAAFAWLPCGPAACQQPGVACQLSLTGV